jgi:hypothetical protein
VKKKIILKNNFTLMETPEFKSIDAKPLVDDGLDGIFNKLCAAGIRPEEGEGDPDTNTVPESWLETFNYLQDNADMAVCVTEEEQIAIVDKIINSIDKEEILKLMNSCRTLCADCINNGCEKRERLSRM